MINTIHSFLIFCLFFSSIQILTIKNPVYLVLFLILIFLDASIILFLFNVDFLALAFIIIYVGAIAILFLFVVMMLNVKSYETELNYFNFFLFFTLFFIGLYFFLSDKIFGFKIENINIFYAFFDTLTNIELIGQVLFNYYLLCFLIAGFVLLVAIVGPVSLTLNFDNYNKINKTRVLSRSSNFLSIFK